MVSIREGDSIPHDMAVSLGLVQGANGPTGQMANRPQAVGPAIAEAQASFGQHDGRASAAPSGFEAVANLAAGKREMRPVAWFPFPASVWPDMPDVKPEHRCFAICRLRAVEEQRAQGNAAGSNFMAAFQEMVKESVWKIGSDDATYDLREGGQVYPMGGWWEAIGPKGRQLVARAYADVNGIDDEVGEQLLAKKTTGWA